MENFAALVARERVKVQGLFGKRDEVVRRIEELMEGLSMSGGEVGRPGKQERKGEEGKGKSEREEVVGLQEQWMALEADFAETVEALKEEVVTIGDETLEVAMEQEKVSSFFLRDPSRITIINALSWPILDHEWKIS